uniref:SWIM-type domain-containing protein n=1 Tax=Dunaliella tertiolecta TaxID=3047 RepID=A0A6S8HTI5_DUNTE|mmetsp:Transcript_7606/g.20272  ORF Transcript_7606/g.20272 Transcript_7606/m.20272 type:complete len:328 (-) Transcript_7606:816-1799(-)
MAGQSGTQIVESGFFVLKENGVRAKPIRGRKICWLISHLLNEVQRKYDITRLKKSSGLALNQKAGLAAKEAIAGANTIPPQSINTDFGTATAFVPSSSSSSIHTVTGLGSGMALCSCPLGFKSVTCKHLVAAVRTFSGATDEQLLQSLGFLKGVNQPHELLSLRQQAQRDVDQDSSAVDHNSRLELAAAAAPAAAATAQAASASPSSFTTTLLLHNPSPSQPPPATTTAVGSLGWQATGSVRQQLQANSPTKLSSPHLLSAFRKTSSSLLAYTTAVEDTQFKRSTVPQAQRQELQHLGRIIQNLLSTNPSSIAHHIKPTPNAANLRQ